MTFQHRGKLIEDGPEVESENPAVAAMNRHKRFSAELIALRHSIHDCASRLDAIQKAHEKPAIAKPGTEKKRSYPLADKLRKR